MCQHAMHVMTGLVCPIRPQLWASASTYVLWQDWDTMLALVRLSRAGPGP
jgi:hypothetical protein